MDEIVILLIDGKIKAIHSDVVVQVHVFDSPSLDWFKHIQTPEIKIPLILKEES